jgi:parvulin-like peptidyl-prolyl isomerase
MRPVEAIKPDGAGSSQRMTRVSPHRRLLACLSALAALALILLATAGCGSAGGDAAAGTDGSPVADAVVATVDGREVRAHEVLQVRAERRFMGETDDAERALDEAVERHLMRREAERLGAAADEAEIGRRMTELESSSGGAAALDGLLEQAGMSREQLRQSVTDGVLREALRDAKYTGVEASAREVAGYYRRNRARLFTRPASVRLGAIQVRTKMVAENAIGRLREGRPFDEVARQFSIDPEARSTGGEMGWVLTSSLPSALRRAVAGAGEGVIRRPVGSGNSWYVLNVEGRRAARVMTLEEVRDRLTTELTQLKRSKALQRWLRAARERATVTTP